MLRRCSIILCVVMYLLSFLTQVRAEEISEQFKIIVNIPSRTLTLYNKNKIVKEYSIGIGTKDTRTPLGKFKIIAKELNPTWIKPIKEDETPIIIKSGPDNPLGYRWMEFAELYGIHGTNNPSSIGGYVSNGCIRMKESDVEELYDMVPLETPIEILYNRIFVKQDITGGYSLYIYPDEYNIQALDVKDVYQKLAICGIQDFVSSDQIDQALQKNSSSVFKIGKTFSIMVFGKQLKQKAVQLGKDVYLPVIPIATEAQIAISWDKEKSLLISPYGIVTGYAKNDVLYVKEKDLYTLFNLCYTWYPDAETMYLDFCKY